MWPSLSEAREQKRDFCSPGWLAAGAPAPLESITNHEMGLCLLSLWLRRSSRLRTTCAQLKNCLLLSLARRHATAFHPLFNKMGGQVEWSSVCLICFQV